MQSLASIDAWDVPHAAAAVVTPTGVLATRGDTSHSFRLASIAKVLTAYAALVAVEEGTVTLEDPVGPPGSTLAHLLAHAAGYGFESDAAVVAAPGTRRIYSNRGIEEAAAHVAARAGMPFGAYLDEAVFAPLGMRATELRGSPAFGVWSTVADVVRFAAELFAPTVLAPETVDEMRAVRFPGLVGVLPGVGRFDPLDWGLGVERNFGRPHHWAGAAVSADTFGHFGGAGTFLWVDRVAGVACACLTDREFGPWALEVWPALSDAVVAEATGTA